MACRVAMVVISAVPMRLQVVPSNGLVQFALS